MLTGWTMGIQIIINRDRPVVDVVVIAAALFSFPAAVLVWPVFNVLMIMHYTKLFSLVINAVVCCCGCCFSIRLLCFWYNDDELISLFLSVHPCDGDNLSRSLCESYYNGAELTELRFFGWKLVARRLRNPHRRILPRLAFNQFTRALTHTFRLWYCSQM